MQLDTSKLCSIYTKFRWLMLLGLLAVAVIWIVPGHSAAEPSDDMPKVLRIGFLQKVFFDTDPRDAKAAVEVHGRELSRSLGLNTAPQVTIYADMASMTAALKRNELEMVSMPTTEYLLIRKTVPLIPAYVSANNNGQGTRYVIIVRKDSGIRSFDDLKGKSLLLPPAAKYEMGNLWLDVLLMQAGKGERDTFFSQIKETPKVSRATMGVFFRQADAAIVTRAVLDISRQLNPQLEKQLTVLAESRNLSDGLVCLLPSTPERFRKRLIDAVIRLYDTASGRQLFAIFQSNGVTRFKPEYLEGLVDLIQEHNRLTLKSVKRK